MSLTIIGDDLAPNYFSVNDLGEVRVIRDLRADTTNIYKVSPVFLSTNHFLFFFYIPSNVVISFITCNRDVRFGPKVVQIGPKWDKSGTFQIRFEI